MKRITLCGSTKFKREFEALNKQLTLEGCVVYSVSCFGHADKIEFTAGQKELLDKVHKQKIDNSDGIFVIDVDGYIGESTKSEISHTEQTGKFVKYLSSYPDLVMMCDSITMKLDTTPVESPVPDASQPAGNDAVSVEEIMSDLWDKYSDGGTVTKAWFDRITLDLSQSLK